MALLQKAKEIQPAHQIAAIKLLAESLYSATRSSTALTNQAQNELGLLLAVLGATETYESSLGADCTHLPVLKKRLQSCHDVLLELQKLHLQPDALGAQSLISDIRARFSSVVFGLSELNTNMMISSQKHIDRALGSLVDGIRAGRDAEVVSEVLCKGSPEGDEAWELLRGELADVGISFELATQSRDLIISTLRRIVETQGLLPGTEEPAVENISEASSPASESDHRLSLDDDLAYEFTGLPFLPLPPIGISYSDKPRSYADQNRSFPDKQPLPTDEYPIPVAMEMEMQESIDPKLQQLQLQPDNIPISIPTETKSGNSTLDLNPPIPIITKPTSNTDSNAGSKPDPTLQVLRTKKATRLSRLRWQLTNPKQPFITSIQQGNLPTVQSHLHKGADPNTQNSTGQTALMVSVSYAHEATTRTLLEYGADPNIQSISGQTALSAACIRGLDRLATMLLLSGAKVDAGRNTGKTALLEAAAYGQERIVRILLDAGADADGVGMAGETALGVAAGNGNLRVVRVLLEGGARVDGGKFGLSPLFDAVRGGWGEVVRVLLQFGADPYFEGRGRVTVVDFARRMGRREVLGVFEEFGVDVGDVPVQYF